MSKCIHIHGQLVYGHWYLCMLGCIYVHIDGDEFVYMFTYMFTVYMFTSLMYAYVQIDGRYKHMSLHMHRYIVIRE